jgi:anaerobic selenocysteine-containing dehydrogenase
VSQQTHYRACHLCEAICGLEIITDGPQIVSIKGDPQDPLGRGHICPKAIALKDLHEDPDRLRSPKKRVGGQWVDVSWTQAFEEISERVAALQLEQGNNVIGVYAGNPNVHNYGNLTHGRVLRKALATQNNFSATSLDQLPHHLIAMLMFGHQFMVPVADIDRTKFMLIFGANPIASNGSMMTVPDVKKRLKSIQQRGGEFVVIDPRRSETAELADQHAFIRPGTDAYVLLAMIRLLFKENLVDTGRLRDELEGLELIEPLVTPFTLELAASQSGISAEVIADITRRFARAESAACYGRMGVSVQAYGSLCQWAIHVLNILTGNLDSEGGVLVPNSAVGYVQPGEPSPGHLGRFHSRISQLPEFGGEFPSTVLAEEILTPGEGQIRGLFTLAGNPVLSAPNGRRLDEAFEQLDLMVSIDIYINETTRHADYILPPTGPLEHDHYDYAFLRLAVHNSARFNEPVFEKPEGALHDWEILNRLGDAISKRKDIKNSMLPPPDMLMDMALQNGPYSKKAGHSAELSLAVLKANPHGVDLGALQPSLMDRICTQDKKIHLLDPLIESELSRLFAQVSDKEINDFPLSLIGRRHVRSNNSWMHNYHRLVKGKPRWQCLMHPDDLAARGIESGQEIKIHSRVGQIQVEVEASDEMMPGVVSVPHGWGHQRKGVLMSIASQQGGQSVNDLTDDAYYDRSTGNAALNGVPVQVSAAV